MKKKALEYAEIIIGSILFSISVIWFADPMGLVIGGISGIAIIVKSFTDIPLFITNLVLNVPLFLIAVKQRGFKFIFKSLLSVLLITLMLEALTFIKNPLSVADDILLTALLTGVFSGAGLGLIFRSGATSGGTDMLASIFKFIKPHFDMSRLLLIIDGIIIISGMSFFGVSKGLYAVIAVVISTLIINFILDGTHFARGAFILSDKYEEISEAIFKELERGNTGINVKGMYTKEEKKMLFVVVNPKETVKLQQIVKNIDQKAFMVIYDVRQTLGEGFFDFKELENKL
ncbi:MAG: YitT family protein [Ruminococcaceae bacterium]|nr:YitT family protein [Oscillospiraceae bacterium]